MIYIPESIRYLPNTEITYLVWRLLVSFSGDFSKEPGAVPVEHILEDYLYEKEKLEFDIVNLSGENGSRDVVGLYDIREHKIYVDRRLYKSKEQRERRMYYFTLAHEIGHAQLHRSGLWWQANNVNLSKPNDYLRLRTLKRTIKNPIAGNSDILERQANFYAASLLMPGEAVYKQFKKLGYKAPIALEDESGYENIYDLAMDVARNMNDVFDVNVSAMAYRLMRLQLVIG